MRLQLQTHCPPDLTAVLPVWLSAVGRVVFGEMVLNLSALLGTLQTYPKCYQPGVLYWFDSLLKIISYIFFFFFFCKNDLFLPKSSSHDAAHLWSYSPHPHSTHLIDICFVSYDEQMFQFFVLPENTEKNDSGHCITMSICNQQIFFHLIQRRGRTLLASCSLSLFISSGQLLLSGRASQKREVLGISREWPLHFPDQMTAASVWKAANNNCLLFSVLFRFFKNFSFPSAPDILSVKQQNKEADGQHKCSLTGSTWAGGSIFMLHIWAPPAGSWVAPSGSGRGESRLAFSPGWLSARAGGGRPNESQRGGPTEGRRCCTWSYLCAQMSAAHWISGDAAVRMINQC